MIILLSPSKTLDMDGTRIPAATWKGATTPALLEESKTLIAQARTLSVADLKKLMKISDALAELNHERFRAFTAPFTAENATPALFAFRGDVYDGLDADSMQADDIAFAQTHLRILSGLYGLLRPLDLMQAYRLEMGIGLKNPRGKNLYAFWGERITHAIHDAARASKSRCVVNLASQEYFDAVHPEALGVPLVTPSFMEIKNGTPKIIGLMAKRARGRMARWLIEKRVQSAQDIPSFDLDGYRFTPELSTEGRFTFTR